MPGTAGRGQDHERGPGDEPDAILVEPRLVLVQDPTIGPRDDRAQLGLGSDHIRKAAVRRRCRHIGFLTFSTLRKSGGAGCTCERRRPIGIDTRPNLRPHFGLSPGIALLLKLFGRGGPPPPAAVQVWSFRFSETRLGPACAPCSPGPTPARAR